MDAHTESTANRVPQEPRTRARRGWQERFIQALSVMPNVRAACEAAGIGRATAYRRRADDQEFAAAWDSAVEEACDRLEEAAWQRATLGRERVTYRRDGSVASRETVPSDQLMIQLLKAHRPVKYRERLDLRRTDDSEVDREIVELARQLGARPDP